MTLPRSVTSRPKCVLVADNFPPTGGGVSRYYSGLAANYGPAMSVSYPRQRWSRDRTSPRYGYLPPGTGRLGQLAQAAVAARISREVSDQALLLGHPHLGLVSAFTRRTHPLGLFIHGGEWREFPKLERMLHLIETRCDLIIANSAATATDWIDARLAARTVVLRPALDSAWIERGRAAAMARRARSQDRPLRILTVARLVARKGIAELARAVLSVRNENRQVELRIVGDGPMLGELRSKFRNEGGIEFLGSIPDGKLHESYAWADAFALCPYTLSGSEGYEGFGIVFLEAAAYGLPIIAARAGGVCEALEVDGSLVAAERDWPQVTRLFRHVIGMSPHLLAKMGQANLRWAARNSWEQRAVYLADLLKR